MYAVIETGGKQYRVELGSEIAVERVEGDPGETLEFERVLLVADDDSATIGRPVVEGARVSASIVRQDRGDKVVVFKYKPKARRRVKHGHRQEQTVLRVADIVYGNRSAAKLAEAALTERQRLEAAAAVAAEERATADRALADKLAEQARAAAAEAAEAAEEAPQKPARGRGRRQARPEEQAGEAAPEAETGVPETEAAAPETEAAALEPEGAAPEAEVEADAGAASQAADETGEQSGGAPEEPAPGSRPRRARARKDE